jgi:ABC-2 type transport system permease protein
LIGILIASIVLTARFAQPIGAAILYPMIALCGLFARAIVAPLQAVARVMPLTYAVSFSDKLYQHERSPQHPPMT